MVRLKAALADVGTAMTLRWVNRRGTELWSSTAELAIGSTQPVREMDMPVIVQIDLPLDGAGDYAWWSSSTVCGTAKHYCTFAAAPWACPSQDQPEYPEG